MAATRDRQVFSTIALLIAICVVTFPAEAKYGGGTGEPNDPYQIWSAEQLNAIGADPNNWDKHFRLMADIDMDDLADGMSHVLGGLDRPFTGTFDGNAHTIAHFTCIGPSADNVGLFGYVCGIDAEIKNLGLIDPTVRAEMREQVGALVGYLWEGTITSCYVRGGVVWGNQMVGGLVGRNQGTISNSYASCRVAGISWIGGFVGANNLCSRGDAVCATGTVLACYAIGAVTGVDRVGGFAGTTLSNVRSCFECFWDVQTSGQATSGGGTGKTTAEMQNPATFVVAGWDFLGRVDGPSDVWTMDPNTRYPMLWWQTPRDLWSTLPAFSGGTGVPDDPYWISSAEELNSIGHNPRLMGCSFRLTGDIDLSQADFYPIGSQGSPFAGVFDGNSRTIVGFVCTRSEGDNTGLFGCIQGREAMVRNLGLVEPCVAISKGSGTGALIGYLNRGTVINCFVEGGTVSGDYYVGGLVGHARSGDIMECHSTNRVMGYYRVGGLVGSNRAAAIVRCHAEGSVPNGAPIGGLVGQNISGTITDCYATGAVTGRGAGGLVGDNSGTLLNCHATGSVTGGGGGLVGTNDGALADCYATGDVSGSGDVGGLTGRNHDHGVIRNCRATGAVRSDSTAGGLAGFSSGLIANSCASGAVTGGDTTGGLAGLTINGLCVNCYSTGDVTGQRYIGGLIGVLNGRLSHCYAVGRVKGTEDVGGLVGNGGGQSVEACFWDIQTSELTAGVNGDGRTTAQLQTSHTFLAAGWDFIGETTNGIEDIWWILEGEDYPRLFWELGEDR
jgi:hypothetical protein